MESNLKETIKEHYGNIAAKVNQGSTGSCCSCSSCCDNISSDIYDTEYLKDLPQEAVQASLGCANPFTFAELKEGEYVLDLGSGGGIDVLMASKYVGLTGKVYGLDMTDEMLALANKNKERMKAENVEFIKGCIEEIPLPDESVNAIISNCVINLSEDKEKALAEAFRVLKKGGRLAVADIVSLKEIPEIIRKQAEMWCGCLARTISPEEYKSILTKVGFTNIEINPVHIYTKEMIESMMEENPEILPGNKEIIVFVVVDGAFAGAYIKAFKR